MANNIGYPDFIHDTIEDYLTQFPDAATRTLAREIFKQHSKYFDNLEQVRSAIRRKRGNSGDASRNAKHARPNGQAGWKPELPPSRAQPWLSYNIPLLERVAVISDTHIPYHNNDKLEEWYGEAQEFEPSVIVLNGDILDFYKLSRFEKNPALRNTSFELDSCHQFLDWLQDRFEAKIVFKLGNHEERYNSYLYNNAPEFAALDDCQLDTVLELVERGIDYVEDQRLIKVGKNFTIFHGHEMYGSGSANPALAMYNKTRCNGLQGHVHKTSVFTERSVSGNFIQCYSTGCLSELNPGYARTSKYNYGWAFLTAYDDDNIEVVNRLVK